MLLWITPFRKKQFILILFNPHCISYTVVFAFCLSFIIFSFLRGDPNMVKLNVAITCGYLFYGMNRCFIMEVQAQMTQLFRFVYIFFYSLLFSLLSSTLLSDLVLLACNWSTMGDVFFVCHHLAALYAYGYVLVSTW